MSYETRAYDQLGDFGSEPVVVLVVSGTHDVSRLVHLFSRGLVEQIAVGERIQRQVRRHNGGRAALALLKAHGGPDFTAEAEPVDPCAGLKVGDEYREDPEYCNAENPATLQLCSRPGWHPGNHVHAQWGEVLAIWPQVSA